MLNERKLTERELDQRKNTLKGLLSNKRALVQKYGKDAEKVMYGIATKQAKNKVESMDKEKIREYIKQALLRKEGFVDTAPLGEPESGQEVDVDTGFSGRADYGAEDKYLGGEDEVEMASANAPVVPSGQTFLPGVPTPKMEEEDLNEAERAADIFNVNVFGYQTKYFKVCPAAKAFMDKVVEGGYGDMSERKNEIIKIAKLHDLLFMKELKAIKDPNYASRIVSSGEVEFIADEIKDNSEDLGIPRADLDYVDNHVNIIFDAAGRIDEVEKPAIDVTTSVLKKINANVNTPKTMAKAILDFIDQVDDNESEAIMKNPKLKMGLKYIKDLADEKDKPGAVSEGHGLGQKDLDTIESLRNQIEQGSLDGKKRDEYVKVLNFLIKSNILQDKTKDLSKGKVNEQNIEDYEVEDAVMELRNIVDDIEQKADEARDIVREIFPNELSRLDAYGAFNAMYSANRYDTTLGKFVDRLEEEGYEIEDGVAYVNEGHMMSMDDLDVGHTDNEPHMLKKELARAGQMIQMLYRAVDKYDGQGEVDFPQWWQKKIIQANAMLDSAFDYIDGEEMVAKIDAMIDNMDKVEIDIDVVDEDVSSANFAKGIEVVKDTLSKEGGAAGLEPLVKELVKLGFKKSEVVDLLKNMTSVKKHRDGDYILLPLEEKEDDKSVSQSQSSSLIGRLGDKILKNEELSKSDKNSLKKIEKELRKASQSHRSQSKALAKSTKAHKSQADRISKLVREKLTKKSEVGDFVDDFTKSKAKQFRGKSKKKKKEMAVAAYLAKQNA